MTPEPAASDDDIRDLSRSYLDSLDSDVDQGKKQAVIEDLEDAKERRDRLVSDLSEDHQLVDRAAEVISDLEEQLSELEEAEAQTEKIRLDLLESVANNFELNETWLDETVIEAVTSALYDERDDAYYLLDERIAGTDDLSDIDSLDRIEMASIVVFLAEASLQGNDIVDDQWERLHTSKGYAAFEIVAKRGPITPSEIADELNQKKSTVNNWLKNPINKWERLIPYYRPEGGEYDLSTTGKYFAARYADEIGRTPSVAISEVDETATEPSTDSSDDDGEDVSRQSELEVGDIESADESGDQRTTSSDVEDTEEKAEALFSNVGTIDEDEKDAKVD